MKSYEMVETLSDKTRVTLEEAKNALDSTNWDIDQAEALLKQRKEANAAYRNNIPQNPASQNFVSGSHLNSLQNETQGTFINPSSSNVPQNGQPVLNHDMFNKNNVNYSQYPNYNSNFTQQGTSVSEMMGRACGNAENVINKGMRSNFVVSRNGRVLFQLPLLVSAILGAAFLPTAAAGLVVGLFFDFKYSIGDNRVENNQFDDIMNKAKKTTDKMKEDFITGRDSTRNVG